MPANPVNHIVYLVVYLVLLTSCKPRLDSGLRDEGPDFRAALKKLSRPYAMGSTHFQQADYHDTRKFLQELPTKNGKSPLEDFTKRRLPLLWDYQSSNGEAGVDPNGPFTQRDVLTYWPIVSASEPALYEYEVSALFYFQKEVESDQPDPASEAAERELTDEERKSEADDFLEFLGSVGKDEPSHLRPPELIDPLARPQSPEVLDDRRYGAEQTIGKISWMLDSEYAPELVRSLLFHVATPIFENDQGRYSDLGVEPGLLFRQGYFSHKFLEVSGDALVLGHGVGFSPVRMDGVFNPGRPCSGDKAKESTFDVTGSERSTLWQQLVNKSHIDQFQVGDLLGLVSGFSTKQSHAALTIRQINVGNFAIRHRLNPEELIGKPGYRPVVIGKCVRGCPEVLSQLEPLLRSGKGRIGARFHVQPHKRKLKVSYQFQPDLSNQDMDYNQCIGADVNQNIKTREDNLKQIEQRYQDQSSRQGQR